MIKFESINWSFMDLLIPIFYLQNLGSCSRFSGSLRLLPASNPNLEKVKSILFLSSWEHTEASVCPREIPKIKQTRKSTTSFINTIRFILETIFPFNHENNFDWARLLFFYHWCTLLTLFLKWIHKVITDDKKLACYTRSLVVQLIINAWVGNSCF